jgi:hypothetical protein
MRAIIATDFEGHLRKLIWLTENRAGVSAGICEGTPDPHATYHVDGRFHCKITSKGQVLKFFSEKKPPLTAITGIEQLLGTASFYAQDIMKRLPPFRPDRRVDALLVLGQSVFRDIACASFNVCIVNRDHEAQFVEHAYSSYEAGDFMLVAVNLFRLEHFTSHELGVVIYKGERRS